jgi:hypothetical protein
MNASANKPAAVKVELNPWYMVNDDTRELHFLSYLKHVKEINVVENEDVEPLSIVVNGHVLAVIDPYDSWEGCSISRCGRMVPTIRALEPRVVFKYQCRRGADYPRGTVSAGYPCLREIDVPENLLTRARPIDVTARMRVNHDYLWARDVEWMLARSTVVEQAELLSESGYNCRFGFASVEQYEAELWDCQVGFDWRGAGYLTHRLIEYIRAGVVPITCPFGEEWPVREDVVLEDGVHGIFCSDPKEFAGEAKSLLRDSAKLQRIRRNLLDLWLEKLAPAAQGFWIWQKLRAAQMVYQVAALKKALAKSHQFRARFQDVHTKAKV